MYPGHADESYRRYIFDLGRQLLQGHLNGEVRLIQVTKTMNMLLNELRIGGLNTNHQNIRFELLSMLDSVGVERFYDMLEINQMDTTAAKLTGWLTMIHSLSKQVKGNPEDSRYKQINDLLYLLAGSGGISFKGSANETELQNPELFTIYEHYLHNDDNIVNNKMRNVYDSTLPNLVRSLLNFSKNINITEDSTNGIIMVNDVTDFSSQANIFDLVVKEIKRCYI